MARNNHSFKVAGIKRRILTDDAPIHAHPSEVKCRKCGATTGNLIPIQALEGTVFECWECPKKCLRCGNTVSEDHKILRGPNAGQFICDTCIADVSLGVCFHKS